MQKFYFNFRVVTVKREHFSFILQTFAATDLRQSEVKIQKQTSCLKWTCVDPDVYSKIQSDEAAAVSARCSSRCLLVIVVNGNEHLAVSVQLKVH